MSIVLSPTNVEKEARNMGSFKGDANSRRVDRAMHHVSKPWFPMNHLVLKRVRDGLAHNTFANNFDALLDELKSDFALFTFIVKELSHRAMLSQDARPFINNPIQLIRWGGTAAINEILAEQQKLPAVHSLHWSESFQVQRLRETAIIASTASALSEKRSLDPELGFSRGVIREIGLNLIAWNYPSTYTKVLNNLSANQSLDDEFAKELGFTPALLGTRLLRPDWSVRPQLQGPGELEWASYDELCEIGEMVARAEHPETYPSAAREWHRARAILTDILGNDAIQLIRKKTIKYSQRYQASLPEVFADISSFDPEQRIQRYQHMGRAIDEKNLQYCSESVQYALRKLYEEMSGESVDKGIVGRLLKDIVPSAGFTGCCVFIIEPTSLALKPRTLLGKVQLRQMQNETLEPNDPAISALSSGRAIIRNGAGPDNSLYAGMYSPLGSRTKIGVLYLERPQATATSVSEAELGVFSALQKALSDALLLQ